jgi:hypothetical protein
MTILFGGRVCYGELGRAEGRTADPSTALRSGRDDKGERGAFSGDWFVDEGTADPWASLGMTSLRRFQVPGDKLLGEVEL